MKAPELSVCIPTYNAARFLPDAIGSVMRQGLDDFEILIIDNASEDETQALLAGLSNPYIRYIRNDANIGSCANGNRLLAEARGKYFKPLCADDVLLDGLLLKQLDVLRSRPDVSLVTCNFIVTDVDLQGDEEVYFFPGSADGSRVIHACLSALHNYIGGPSNVMFRLEDAAGLTFDMQYRWVNDLKFWLQLLRRGNYVNLDEIGCLYRRHPNTDSATNCPNDIRIAEFLRLAEDFDDWNVLNCIQAMRRGERQDGLLGMHKWLQALRNIRPWADTRAAADIWRQRAVARRKR
jgi:glycosyltransferase involved in cell wall biosynthesis